MKVGIKKRTADPGQFRAIAIGASAGGIDALRVFLPCLPKNYPLSIIIVLHIPADQPSMLVELFGAKSELRVKEAEEKERIQPGTIYFAPPGYHLLVERDFTFSLSTEEPVHFSRPSIDVLFETAADAFASQLVGILLSGANKDGADGLRRIQEADGLALVQDPATAQVRIMPEAGRVSLDASEEQILSLPEIAQFLLSLGGDSARAALEGPAFAGSSLQ